VQARDEGRWCPGPDHHAQPEGQVQRWQTCFGGRWHFGELRQPLRSAHGKRLEFASGDVGQSGSDAIEQQVDLPPEQVVHCGRGPLVRHVIELPTRLGLEHFAQQMPQAARAL